LGAFPVRQYTAVIEDSINKYCTAEEPLVNLYGFLQKLQGKRLIGIGQYSYVCQSPANYLVYGGRKEQLPDAVIERRAKYVIELNDYLKQRNIPLLFVPIPNKTHPRQTEVLPGLYNHSHEEQDRTLAFLRNHNVDCFDLRDDFLKSGKRWEDLYYRTGHHWTLETGIWVAALLLDRSKETLHLPQERFEFLTDMQNYKAIGNPDSLLGYLGTQTGAAYSGRDDLTYYVPKFPTRLTRNYVRTTGIPKHSEGTFEECLIFPTVTDRFRDDITYLNGNHAYQEILNPEGNGKVLVFMDSFSMVVVSFLSLHTERVVAIDPRYTTKSIYETLKEDGDFDMVICITSGGILEEKMFWSPPPEP
jgi:hypothetical protein